jgi:hypothetical protein
MSISLEGFASVTGRYNAAAGDPVDRFGCTGHVRFPVPLHCIEARSRAPGRQNPADPLLGAFPEALKARQGGFSIWHATCSHIHYEARAVGFTATPPVPVWSTATADEPRPQTGGFFFGRLDRNKLEST